MAPIGSQCSRFDQQVGGDWGEHGGVGLDQEWIKGDSQQSSVCLGGEVWCEFSPARRADSVDGQVGSGAVGSRSIDSRSSCSGEQSKTRTQENSRGMEGHPRSSVSQCHSAGGQVPDGLCGLGAATSSKGVVHGNLRSQGWLPSHCNQPRVSHLLWSGVERSGVHVGSDAIWPVLSTKDFHEVSEASGEALAVPGDYRHHSGRRCVGDGSNREGSIATHGGDGEGLPTVGSVVQSEKEQVVPSSTGSLLWCGGRSAPGVFRDTSGTAGKAGGVAANHNQGGTKWQANSCKGSSFTGRQDSVLEASFCSSSVDDSRAVQVLASGLQQGLEQLHQALTTSIGGCRMAGAPPGGVEWQGSVATSPTRAAGDRCISNSLCCTVERGENVGSLDRAASSPVISVERAQSYRVGASFLVQQAARQSGTGGNRLTGSSCQHQPSWSRERDAVGGGSQHMGHCVASQHNISRGGVDTSGTEHSSGFAQQAGGLARLEAHRQIVQEVGSTVGPSLCRSFCSHSQHLAASVQQQVLVPRYRGSQCIGTGLVKGQQFGSGSIPCAGSGAASFAQAESCGHSGGSSVASSALVASSNGVDAGPYRVVSSGFSGRTIRQSGTLEKSQLAVLGSESGSRLVEQPDLWLVNARTRHSRGLHVDLAEVAVHLRRKRFRSGTIKSYSRLLQDFSGFVKHSEVSLEIIEAFLGHLYLSGRVGSARTAINAIRTTWDLAAVQVDRLYELVKGMEAQHKLEGGGCELRDPMQPESLQCWVASLQSQPLGRESVRDITMALWAFRTLKRPSEVVAWDLDDIKLGYHTHADWMAVRDKKTKNDPLGVEVRKKWVPVEPTGGRLCPVFWMHQWLGHRGHGAGPLFLAKKGGRLYASHLTKVAKAIKQQEGSSWHYTGYSFRIGGATALAAAGVDVPVIQALGGWSSDAIFRYLRAIAAAARGASSHMGL